MIEFKPRWFDQTVIKAKTLMKITRCKHITVIKNIPLFTFKIVQVYNINFIFVTPILQNEQL